MVDGPLSSLDIRPNGGPETTSHKIGLFTNRSRLQQRLRSRRYRKASTPDSCRILRCDRDLANGSDHFSVTTQRRIVCTATRPGSSAFLMCVNNWNHKSSSARSMNSWTAPVTNSAGLIDRDAARCPMLSLTAGSSVAITPAATSGRSSWAMRSPSTVLSLSEEVSRESVPDGPSTYCTSGELAASRSTPVISARAARTLTYWRIAFSSTCVRSLSAICSRTISNGNGLPGMLWSTATI